ncbi:ComEA family DNA-binding protein [Pedobacter sp. AW1-32]|uniref:ComEA family DNA-binding protein n=1 Tax=Pedobacter sp. AW1-32 TaxID=3383026 RepID=UPI003FF147FB
MRTWLNKSFGFSRSQYNGLIVLILIVLLVKCIPYLYRYLQSPPINDINLRANLQELEFLEKSKALHSAVPKNTAKKKKLFYFNPNTLDQTGWVALGLSEKQAGAVLNYVRKGGKFRQPADLQKMYTISPGLYKELYPYVNIPEETAYDSKAKPMNPAFEKKAPVYIEINGADSAALDRISGIGGTFANRILRYRQRLGGFYAKTQLMEVYGLDSVKFAQIKDQFYVDATKMKAIKINVAEFEDLKAFPYLSYKQMNAIIQYRKQHGVYRDKSDLAKVILLNPSIIEKISPYLIF